MRRYTCPQCGNEIHFQNSSCVNCGSALQYDPSRDAFAVTGAPLCANSGLIGCNWVADPQSAGGLCACCGHTHVIPDLSQGPNLDYWTRLEQAKRLLFRSLIRLGLPMARGGGAGQALIFDLKADEVKLDGTVERSTTGHDNGLITINIEEADDAIREKNRTRLGEPYRTLIGHFRHEVGHFYWDVLVDDGGRLEDFRAVFGDEREDYAEALKAHYAGEDGAYAPGNFVTDYAASHPWEDFAETWAHYLHMLDGLETAEAYGIRPDTQDDAPFDPYTAADFDGIVKRWVPVTVAMNAMNRSIGNIDFYPFVMSKTIESKLRFIHALVRGG